MFEQIICPSCGQLYDAEEERCPACGEPAPAQHGFMPEEECWRPQDETAATRVVYRPYPRIRVQLIASLVILLLSLTIAVTYLLWQGGMIESSIYSSLSSKQTEASSEATEDASNTGFVLSPQSLTFTAPDEQQQILVQALPAGATGQVTYSSSDPTVATVGATGLVASVGEGEAYITVSCGEASVQCPVRCAFSS